MRGSNQKRQIKTKNEKKRLLLICEGSRTEPLYFYDLWQDKRNRKVVVEIPKCKDTEPIKLVKFADKYLYDKMLETATRGDTRNCWIWRKS